MSGGSSPGSAAPEVVIERYLDAIRAKSADALADLYAPDAVHVFPFNHGEDAVLEGRETIRARYTAGWGRAAAAVRAVDRLVTHRCEDGETIVAEFDIDLTHTGTGADFTVATILVARIRNGAIVSLRDYNDALTIARALGRL
jgi:ketosteroid isomerase-like protein